MNKDNKEEKTEDDFLDHDDVSVSLSSTQAAEQTVQDIYFQQKQQQQQYHHTPRSTLLDFFVLSDVMDAMVTAVVAHDQMHLESACQLDAQMAAELHEAEEANLRLSLSYSHSHSERTSRQNSPSHHHNELHPSTSVHEEENTYRLSEEQLADVLAARKEEKRAKKKAIKKEQRALERQIKLENRAKKVSVEDMQKALRNEQQQPQSQQITPQSSKEQRREQRKERHNQTAIDKLERDDLLAMQNTFNFEEDQSKRVCGASSPRVNQQYTPHVITDLSFYETLLKKVFNISPPNDTTPRIALNTVVRYLPPEVGTREVEIPLVTPDSEEAQYRAMRIRQSDQNFMDRQAAVRQARSDFEGQRRAYLQPVYEAFPTFLSLGALFYIAIVHKISILLFYAKASSGSLPRPPSATCQRAFVSACCCPTCWTCVWTSSPPAAREGLRATRWSLRPSDASTAEICTPATRTPCTSDGSNWLG
jgi:hypothetical protein